MSLAPITRIASPENEIAISRGFLSRISTRRRVCTLRDHRNGASRYQPCDTTVDSKLKLAGAEMEATAGIEPADEGFADLCLTTWLRRPGSAASLVNALRVVNIHRPADVATVE